MPDPLIALAVAFASLAALFFGLAFKARREPHKRVRRMATRGTLGLLTLVTALLFATLTVSTLGYRALTHEEVVLVVTTIRTGPQRFDARVEFPDGTQEIYPLRGDELYVDARILKWKPVANVLGLHTQYELDRIAGRYTSLADEQSRPRTVYPLSTAEPLDLFQLRRSYPLLAPLLDAEYGSGTFVPVEDRTRFEVRLSTSGLLVRRAPGESVGTDQPIRTGTKHIVLMETGPRHAVPWLATLALAVWHSGTDGLVAWAAPEATGAATP